MAYNKDQWISSFEDHMTILRPHLTQRPLAAMALVAWRKDGTTDPIQAAKLVSAELADVPRPQDGQRSGSRR